MTDRLLKGMRVLIDGVGIASIAAGVVVAEILFYRIDAVLACIFGAAVGGLVGLPFFVLAERIERKQV